jgi:thioredoxin reductase (NADPH)
MGPDDWRERTVRRCVWYLRDGYRVVVAKPVLMVISDDREHRVLIEEELARRYGADYEVVCEGSADATEQVLERLRGEGRRLAVVLADQWRSGTSGPELLSHVRDVHPDAKRVLLIPWVDPLAAEAVRRAAALGQIDFWTVRPWRSPDEDFHAVMSEALRAWSRSNLPPFEIVRVVGERWSARSHELRDLLSRNAIPHGFYEAASDEGRSLLEQARVSAERLPVLVLFDERTLVDPSNSELAEALGVRTRPASDAYDVVVIGAGPSGLAASVYGTSEGLRTALLEREAIGGQAGTTSLIRNYLGFPRGVSGGELAQRAYEQAWLFGTEFIYGNGATALRADDPHRI